MRDVSTFWWLVLGFSSVGLFFIGFLYTVAHGEDE